MRPVIRWALVAVVTVHGLIHLLGAARGFRWADVSQLQHEISSGMAAAAVSAAADRPHPNGAGRSGTEA